MIASPIPERPVAEPLTPQPQPPPATPSDDAIPSISEVVARIERLRVAREDIAPPASAPPAVDPPSRAEPAEKGLFRWECNPSGEIAWVDGVPRGALIGRSLAQPSGDHGIDPAIAAAFARRTSFHEALLILPGKSAASGQWRMSGVPAFEPSDGRFAGFRGIATRGEPPITEEAGSGQDSGSEHDSIRELVHELKTPLNAIIGFAEMIDGQYLGPANDRYRARAAEIVGQARLLVTAIDDLDLAARLQSGREPPTAPVQVSDVLGQLAPELHERATDRGALLELEGVESGATCSLDPGISGQLIRRFCEAAIDLCAPDEPIRITLQMLRDRCSLSASLPASLRSDDAQDLLAGTPAGTHDDEPDPFFWLRLVRGLARIAGGEVMTADGKLSLILPKTGR
jgi:hypothetical protein